jgi:putative DNA methylase
MIQRARKDILAANNGNPPKVLDPFGGGGAIPLEALRLGCETYSNDLNPVAVSSRDARWNTPRSMAGLRKGPSREPCGSRWGLKRKSTRFWKT